MCNVVAGKIIARGSGGGSGSGSGSGSGLPEVRDHVLVFVQISATICREEQGTIAVQRSAVQYWGGVECCVVLSCVLCSTRQ